MALIEPGVKRNRVLSGRHTIPVMMAGMPWAAVNCDATFVASELARARFEVPTLGIIAELA